MKKIVIVGASGFGREIAWVIERVNQVRPQWEIAGFCDDDPSTAVKVAATAPFLGSVAEVVSHPEGRCYICAIGNNLIRKRLMEQFAAAGWEAVTITDPTAVVASKVEIGVGSYVGVHSVVSTGAQLGQGCIVNHNATVGHDVIAADYVQICPGVSVSGGCDLGEGALLGSNSCTIPGKKMGAWSTLGAGSVLLSELEGGGSRIRIR